MQSPNDERCSTPLRLTSWYGDRPGYDGDHLRLLTVGEAMKVLGLGPQQVRNLTVTDRTPEPGELYPVAVTHHGTRCQYLFTEACVERVKRVRDSRIGKVRPVKQLPLAMGPRRVR